jgi:hypothetical protein
VINVVAVGEGILFGVSNGVKDGGVLTSVKNVVLVEVDFPHQGWHFVIAVLWGCQVHQNRSEFVLQSG